METVHAPLKAADVGAPHLEDLEPADYVVVPLQMDERNRLNEIFRDPAFIKAWKNLRAVRPGPLFTVNPGILGGPTGPQLASNRLHEMRGWEMFSAALLNQAKEPTLKPVKTQLDEYPDAGTIEAEAQRNFKPAPAKAPGQPFTPNPAVEPVSGYPRPPKKTNKR